MYIVLIKPGGETEAIPVPKAGPSLQSLQQWVGGSFEAIFLVGNMLLLVDEDGLLKHLPLNTKASLLAKRAIVGPTVVCVSKGGEMVGMPYGSAKLFLGDT